MLQKRSFSSSSEKEKRPKIEESFLSIDDENFSESQYEKLFEDLADRLMNKSELVINGKHRFRLIELEFYFFEANQHPDCFVHCHPEQSEHSNWYFHRQGNGPTNAFKSGTFKFEN